MISERWLEQQRAKLAATATDSPLHAQLAAEIEAAERELAETKSRLDALGLRVNRYPGNCVVTGERVQGGDGFIHKNAAGRWDTYSKAGAAERFGV